MNIGFIGLGVMGKAMARNLIKAGYQLSVYDINSSFVDTLTSEGATAASSAKEVADLSDVIFTMLPGSPQVKSVILDENGVREGLKKGSIVVDTSSGSPLVSQEISAELEKIGVAMLDAPVSGGEPKAIDGTLAIMVGGPEEAFNRVEQVLHAMGTTVTHVGEIGSGNTTKLANQIMVATHLAGMAEALVFSTKAGVDPEKVFKAIRGGLAQSTVFDAKMPLILEGNFTPGARMDLHIKDLRNALDTAESIEAPIPLSDSIYDMMKALSDAGKGSDDHGGLIQWYEKEASVQVRK